MNSANAVLQIVIYLGVVFEIGLAIYVFALDPRDTTNRYLSAVLAAFAVMGIGVAGFIGAATSAQAVWPSYIVSASFPAINPLELLVVIALIKPNWITSPKRWLVWFVYVLAVLPVTLVLVDLLAGTQLFYTGINAATYQGGLLSQKDYYNGTLYSTVSVINFYIISFVSLGLLIYTSFFDKTLLRKLRRISRILLTAHGIIFVLFAVRPVSIEYLSLFAIVITSIAYSIIAMGRLISSRMLERGLSRISLRRKLYASFGFALAVIVTTGVVVIFLGGRIQRLLAQLIGVDFSNPVAREAALSTFAALRTAQILSFTTIAGVLFLTTVVGAFVFSSLVREIVESINILQHAAEQLGAGDLSVRAEVQGSDELAVTANALNTMADQLAELLNNLEQEVQRRTKTLEASAEISRQLAAISDLNELLHYAVNQIRDGFDLYYTHIYLVDDKTSDLVMMAGSGEVGKLLKAKGHRLKSGAGIVGAVASLNEHFMSNNVHEAINWVPNVLLPDTNSELALPLRKGDQVLGVLDIQSSKLNHFSAEDVITMQSLANQIAAAVDNARLLAETQKALQEVERLNRRLTREAWQEFEQDLGTSGYRFVKKETAAVQPASGLWLPPMRQAAAAKQPVKQLRPGNGDPAKSELAVPLILRGEVIGALGIKREGESDWTPEEETVVNTVADQIARALESARLTEEQAKTIGQLKEVDRLKTGFLTSMSHELRTPLNSIIGFADILLQGIDGPLEENAITDITAIHGSGKHLLALINDILDLSKIEAGRMELVYSAVSIPIVFKEVAASVSSLLKDRPIRLIQKAGYELPKIWADPLRFSQIVINLVSNAVKFTEEGTVTIGAEVFNDREMHIYVQDTGIGIPEDKLDMVFESFRQVDARNNRKYQGTGMGLAISKQLVEIHGGQMWVESVLGEGTTFHFTIGLAPEGELVIEK